ncbi:YrrS family protein [Virgibacillus ndiopensis]|uniref:YrrS family protein n=1 Tax=Virgibacillus ndiopensis TaxID=2004408 RepID=UPI000C068A52|nr:YrrS family protein [Virgibacillus ndiopensis]
MSDFDNHSRVDKFEKRRKNTKLLSITLVLGGIFIVVLIGIFIFGGGDDEPTELPNNISNRETTSDSDQKTDNAETDDSTNTDEDNASTDEENTTDDENTSDDSSNNNTEVEKEPVESDDANVESAYTGNWEPIGTEQQGPHTTTYDEGTQDRIEMENAIRVATGLQDGDMITWWLENGGDQKVIGTVSNNAQTETYRVYLSWVENKGWQPTKVEVLKENDKK